MKYFNKRVASTNGKKIPEGGKTGKSEKKKKVCGKSCLSNTDSYFWQLCNDDISTVKKCRYSEYKNSLIFLQLKNHLLKILLKPEVSKHNAEYL